VSPRPTKECCTMARRTRGVLRLGFGMRSRINAEVRAAINRILVERPLIGEAYLFPSPLDPSRPISKELADKWLLQAEKLAGLSPRRWWVARVPKRVGDRPEGPPTAGPHALGRVDRPHLPTADLPTAGLVHDGRGGGAAGEGRRAVSEGRTSAPRTPGAPYCSAVQVRQRQFRLEQTA